MTGVLGLGTGTGSEILMSDQQNNENAERIHGEAEQPELPRVDIRDAAHKRHTDFVAEGRGDHESRHGPQKVQAHALGDVFVMQQCMQALKQRSRAQAVELIVEGTEAHELENAEVHQECRKAADGRCEQRMHVGSDLDEECDAERRGESKAEEESREEHRDVAMPVELVLDNVEVPEVQQQVCCDKGACEQE